MHAVSRYVADMLVYIIAFLPVYVIVRILFIRLKNGIKLSELIELKKLNKISLHREIAMAGFAAFIYSLASFTVIPSSLSDIGYTGVNNATFFRVFDSLYADILKFGITNFYFMINFLGNIVMFIPVGFFPPLLWKNVSVKKAVAIGFLSSLFIEVSQMFLPRQTDVDDLILNTSGALLGIFVYCVVNKFFPKFSDKLKIEKHEI